MALRAKTEVCCTKDGSQEYQQQKRSTIKIKHFEKLKLKSRDEIAGLGKIRMIIILYYNIIISIPLTFPVAKTEKEQNQLCDLYCLQRKDANISGEANCFFALKTANKLSLGIVT